DPTHAAGVGVCEPPAEAPPWKLVSPLYVATSVFEPVVVGVRLQLVAGSVITQLLVPSLMVIVPAGVPHPGAVTATAAVTAIGELTSDGFGVCVPIVVVVAALLSCGLPLPAPLLALAANVAVPA